MTNPMEIGRVAADRRNECILITGAARRLGRALAESLARRSTALILHYHRSESEAESLARRCEDLGARTTLIAADLAAPADIDRLIAACRDHRPCPTGIVNNAALYVPTPLTVTADPSWNEMIAVNLTAPGRISAELGLSMKRAGRGSIVFVGDVYTRRPYRDYLAYMVSKGALETAARALARELAPEVRVNVAAFGPMLASDATNPESESRLARAVPLGRLGGTQAFVDAVTFLLFDAVYCTGTILAVDGGRNLAL